MAIAPIVALGTLVFTLVNFLKFLSVRDWKAVTSQVIAWAAGVAGIFIMGATQFASGIHIGDVSLANLDGWSKLLVGLIATSLLSTVNEVKKAIDNRDTARMPSWFERRPAPTATAMTVPEEWTEEVRHTRVTD